MSALAVAHPHAAYPRPVLLRPVPALPNDPARTDDRTPVGDRALTGDAAVTDAADSPVTVTISVSGGARGREQVLAALRELVSVAGAGIELDAGVAAGPAGGEIELDPRARTAFRDGHLLEFSRLEYDLLLFLARHPRQVFSRAQLLTHVWGHRHTTNRTVDVHVSRLRTKLGDPELITTVYGLGYRLADEAPIVVADR